MRLRVLGAAVLATATVVASAVPATAASVTFRDPAGDAPRRYDLTRVHVDNGAELLTVRVKVRALRGGSAQVFGLFLNEGPDEANYTLHSVRRADGVVRHRFWVGPDRVACDATSRWRLGRDTIAVRIPQGCFEENGALRVSALIGAGNGTSGDPADWTRGLRVGHG